MEPDNFLTGSPVARKVKLTGKVIIHRAAYSPSEIAAMKATGSYGPVSRDETVCELEVNGIILAKGKIVKKAGEYYFKVLELNKEETI
jgi:hypothetical protein